MDVPRETYADAALVLIGHGTALNPESAAPVNQHATELRRRGCFAEVHGAFWKQAPQIQQVLRCVQAARVFLVPFFISEGYFSEQVIPEALGFGKDADGLRTRTQLRGAQSWFYCRPVGTHPSMTEVLLARARGVVAQFPFPRPPKPADISLFIAGHGTEQDENSRRVIEQQVERIRQQNLYAAVKAIFLEEEPRIASCYDTALARNVVVVPFFMSNGLHVSEDIPVLLGEPKRLVEERQKNGQPTWRNPTEKRGKLVWYAPSVGTEPGLAEVILERVREAAGKPEKTGTLEIRKY